VSAEGCPGTAANPSAHSAGCRLGADPDRSTHGFGGLAVWRQIRTDQPTDLQVLAVWRQIRTGQPTDLQVLAVWRQIRTDQPADLQVLAAGRQIPSDPVRRGAGDRPGLSVERQASDRSGYRVVEICRSTANGPGDAGAPPGPQVSGTDVLDAHREAGRGIGIPQATRILSATGVGSRGGHPTWVAVAHSGACMTTSCREGVVVPPVPVCLWPLPGHRWRMAVAR